MAGAGLDPSSQALLNKLDECLVGCIPKKVENAHGVDYTIGAEKGIPIMDAYDALQTRECLQRRLPAVKNCLYCESH